MNTPEVTALSDDELGHLRADYENGTWIQNEIYAWIGENVGRLLATIAERDARVRELEAEVEECHAKATCCCGDYMKTHASPIGCGHSPVSMYDYALDNALEELAALKSRAVSGDDKDKLLWCIRRLKADDYKDMIRTIDDIISAGFRRAEESAQTDTGTSEGPLDGDSPAEPVTVAGREALVSIIAKAWASIGSIEKTIEETLERRAVLAMRFVSSGEAAVIADSILASGILTGRKLDRESEMVKYKSSGRFLLVENMGGVWRISKGQYKKVLQSIIDRKEFDLDDWGTRVGLSPINLTDLHAEQAAILLNDMESHV